MRFSSKRLAYTGVLSALCFVATAYISIPSVSGGHTNLSDAVIFLASFILGPVGGFFVGGVGTFIADLVYYPATMFYSLIIHGLEGLICGFIMYAFRNTQKKWLSATFSAVAMLVSGIFMFVMFFFAKWLFYGTLESALISLPRNVLQAVISAAVAMVIIYVFNLPARIGITNKSASETEKT